MKLTVFQNRRRTASFAAAVVAVAALGAAAPEAVAKAPDAAVEKVNPFADRFPNLVLKTHEGKNVRFYDDLLKGKIVLINFFYATCKER